MLGHRGRHFIAFFGKEMRVSTLRQRGWLTIPTIPRSRFKSRPCIMSEVGNRIFEMDGWGWELLGGGATLCYLKGSRRKPPCMHEIYNGLAAIYERIQCRDKGLMKLCISA